MFSRRKICTGEGRDDVSANRRQPRVADVIAAEWLSWISLTSVVWLLYFAVLAVREGPARITRPRGELVAAAGIVLIAGLLSLPTRLGLLELRFYEHGERAVVLIPVFLSVLAIAAWFRAFMLAGWLAIVLLAYLLGILPADNKWDYLVDPIALLLAGLILWAGREHLRWRWPPGEAIQACALITTAVFLAYAVYISRIDPDAFRYSLVVEDGFVESVTVVVLLTAMVVCFRRFIQLRGERSPLFLFVTFLLGAFCMFGAGEEISWGQRIFGLESPEFFEENNAQGEIGLHNLVIEIDGEEVKLNKLIFGTGLALAMLIYLFVATPLYRRQPAVTKFFDAIAAPMPRNYQIIGYLVIVAVVELLIDHSKRGEMTEFAASIMFALNVIYPDNEALFEPGQKAPETPNSDSAS